jgi:hypothetical protein
MSRRASLQSLLDWKKQDRGLHVHDVIGPCSLPAYSGMVLQWPEHDRNGKIKRKERFWEETKHKISSRHLGVQCLHVSPCCSRAHSWIMFATVHVPVPIMGLSRVPTGLHISQNLMDCSFMCPYLSCH